MKIRCLAIIMAAVLLFSMVSCGVTEVPSETETSKTDTENITEQVTEFFPQIEKQDYEDEVFRMIGVPEPGSWYYSEGMSTEQGGTHVLNNAVYEMNCIVEEYLGVTLEYERPENAGLGNEVFDAVLPTFMSGDDVYQLCILHPYFGYTSFITSNLAYDFYEMPHVDITQDYWNKKVIDSLAINGKAYIALGDICNYTLNMLYVNKDMLSEVGRSVPYDEVRKGQWTLDKMTALTSELYADNGDGQRNSQDVYGFASLWDAGASAFMQASGIYIVTRSEDDVFELTIYSERLENMYSKLYEWIEDESTYVWDWPNAFNESVVVDFRDSTAYVCLNTLGTQYLDATFDVGMLPLPKYDAAQEQYAHVNWGNNIIVPSTIKNDEMVGQVLEIMSYYSKTLVQEEYYDNVLQLRVSDAPDDREMVELMYSTVVYDPGIAFCHNEQQLWNLVYLPSSAINSKIQSVSSYYERNKRGAERTLLKLFK